MKKYLSLLLVFALAGAAVSCEDTPLDEIDDETPQGNTPGTNPGNGGGSSSVAVPDCFVYFKGAKFIFTRTLDTGKSIKITWDVTDYNSSTQTATISSKVGDDNPGSFQIRKSSKGIEFNQGGSWKATTDGDAGINFLLGSKLNSIPSGIYGSVPNKTKLVTVSIPGGKSSQGFSISSSYQPTTGYHDSFMFDYSSGETWCTECGIVSAGYQYRNGKEYPIFVSTYETKLVAYDIPMPDGSRRTYMPAGATVYDVADTYISYSQHPAKTQRYASMFFYWNDTKNSNVMRYVPCALWYDGGWKYAQITEDMNVRWSFYSWFIGKASSGSPIGGPKDGVSFGCSGLYLSEDGSQSYTPFGTASSPNYGYFVLFVLAENSIAMGEPDLDRTEFALIEIPDPSTSYAAMTYSDRVQLNDDGTVDYYTKTKGGHPVRPSVPDPSMISGLVYRLSR